MKLFIGSAFVLTLVTFTSATFNAQTPAPGPGRAGRGAPAADADRAVADGGIFAKGWQGAIDPNAQKQGQTVNNARLSQEANNVLKVTTGPAITYWNPANTASGNYTVKATFNEPQYMNLNDHPHPYGIMIAGNDMGTPEQSYLYCAAYGNGRFIMRGFGGPTVFNLNGRGAEAPSVARASGRGAPVTQEIAITVDADSVDCSINGTVVGSYPKAELIASGRLKSTDGVYGIRFAHNTEGTVTGLTMTKN
jgi:hypothetical protein